MSLRERDVFIARCGSATYTPENAAPAGTAVRELFQAAGMDPEHFGSAQWNPLGCLIRPGSFVLLKPNWVLDSNRSGHGLECLVTHGSVLKAVLWYVLRARPGRVVIGDAPVQGCDFTSLRRKLGLDEILEGSRQAGIEIAIRDFRLVSRAGRQAWSEILPGERRLQEYVLFNLGARSPLEQVTTVPNRFRVTMYDPRAMTHTHGPGRHCYLVAREAVEADCIINLPKLKTHRKAGLTAALKNMVGINGHKAYLPHHRLGATAEGGDCYAAASSAKRAAEDLLDLGNTMRSRAARRVLAATSSAILRLLSLCGGDGTFEGSWSGNDTLWRTVADLQAIARYGQADGTLADVPRRTILSITDAIVAGEGEGPLEPRPAPLGILTMGMNAAAADWVNAIVLGLDPARIPLTREIFRLRPYHLVDFSPAQIRVCLPDRFLDVAAASRLLRRAVIPPAGWTGRCELEAGERAVAC